jgi:hypothetical protein
MQSVFPLSHRYKSGGQANFRWQLYAGGLSKEHERVRLASGVSEGL